MAGLVAMAVIAVIIIFIWSCFDFSIGGLMFAVVVVALAIGTIMREPNESKTNEKSVDSENDLDVQTPIDSNIGVMCIENGSDNVSVNKENKRKRKHLFIAFLIIFTIIITSAVYGYEMIKRNKLEEIAFDICQPYGLENLTVEITGSVKYEGYRFYEMKIKGEGAEKIGYEKLVELITDVEDDVKLIGILHSFIIDGKAYRFYEYSGRLYSGYDLVYSISDEGDNSKTSSSNGSSNAISKLKKQKKSYGNNSYNANNYSDPEDFYDDYYDDFYSYEDAEDYYYDNR